MFNSTTRHRVAVKTMVTTLETLVLYSSWLTGVEYPMLLVFVK
jgi:hypothetical protein